MKPEIVVVRCPDCGAPMQLMYGYMRCPWTLDGIRERFVIEGRTIRCNWPYKNSDRRIA